MTYYEICPVSRQTPLSRIEYEGAFYHVTARGNEPRGIYFTKSDYEKLRLICPDSRADHVFPITDGI